MPQFTFDVKLFATVYVNAEDEATGRELVDNYVADLVEGGAWNSADDSQRVEINSASLDGEHDLMEIDGKPV